MLKNRICIITGLSGSGKSTALDAFEDAGFYCVDNMPVDLLPCFLDLHMEKDLEINGFAFVMDLREKKFPSKCTSIFNQLKKQGRNPEIIFLLIITDLGEASDSHPKKPRYTSCEASCRDI